MGQVIKIFLDQPNMVRRLSVCLTICLYLCPSAYMPLSACLSVFLSVCVYRSVGLSVRLSVQLSIRPSVWLSVCPWPWKGRHFWGFLLILLLLFVQGILKGEVSMYHWPPVWLVWISLIKTNIVCSHTADSKPVKQGVNRTVTLPPLVFTDLYMSCTSRAVKGSFGKFAKMWHVPPILQWVSFFLTGTDF